MPEGEMYIGICDASLRRCCVERVSGSVTQVYGVEYLQLSRNSAARFSGRCLFHDEWAHIALRLTKFAASVGEENYRRWGIPYRLHPIWGPIGAARRIAEGPFHRLMRRNVEKFVLYGLLCSDEQDYRVICPLGAKATDYHSFDDVLRQINRYTGQPRYSSIEDNINKFVLLSKLPVSNSWVLSRWNCLENEGLRFSLIRLSLARFGVEQVVSLLREVTLQDPDRHGVAASLNWGQLVTEPYLVDPERVKSLYLELQESQHIPEARINIERHTKSTKSQLP